MGRAIIKIKDKYFEWSSIVDAPVTYGMSKDELKNYIKKMYGEKGLRELPTRLLRVEETGTSFIEESLEDLISFNRAGDKEQKLTKNEIYQKYATGGRSYEPKRKANE